MALERSPHPEIRGAAEADDAFDIRHKNASPEQLRRLRVVWDADLKRSNSLPPGNSIHANSSVPHIITNDSSNLKFTNKASASTEPDIEEGLHSTQSTMRPLFNKENARLLDRTKATGDIVVAGADSGHPDMLEKIEKILILLLSFSLPLCVTAYPIVKDLPETERHLAYGLMGSVPAILFLGLLPTLFTKSPKAGTFGLSALLLSSGIVIGLFTWAWCSLNPSVKYAIPMGVAGALLLCATIILMVAFFQCRKRPSVLLSGTRSVDFLGADGHP